VLLASFALATALAAPPARHVVLVSVDGLMPASYTAPEARGLAVPTLRRLAAAGAFARGVVGVLPSVTYPAHTTMITGVPPRRHGIYGNTYLDPTARTDDAWRWYAREIRVPTLVDAVRASGRTVGSVGWPVSVGSSADFLVPEMWRNRSRHERDLDLLRALSTPGLFDAVPVAPGSRYAGLIEDEARIDLALHILRRHRPALLLLHLLEVDSAAHTHGPEAPETRAAIEGADARLGRLLAALDESGLAASTLVAVVSDHGFLSPTRLVRPNALLVDAGLATLDDKGVPVDWKAWFFVHGGSASLHLADPADQATRARARELIAARMAEPGSCIAAIVEGERLERFDADPSAELFLDAADDCTFSRTPTGGWEGKPVDRGYHGHTPDRPGLHASLILSAPRLGRRGDLGIVPMTAIAATLGGYLGVELPDAAGALPVFPASTRDATSRPR
jgi:arylsulfatase A-like enzyme